MTERVANIGERGARRRRLGGVVWLGVGIGLLVSFVMRGEPRTWRLVLFVPFALAAAGFLQAREKT